MSTTSSVSSNQQAIYDALNGTSGSSSSSSSSSTSSSKAQQLSTEFMTLLTTQLKNQDPTNPASSTEMVSEMAQISTVEGVSNLGTSLSTLMANMQNTDYINSSALVNQTVLADGSKLTLSSGNAAGGVYLNSAADSVVVTIKDSSGSVVNTVDLGALDAGVNTFTWDGKNAAGTAVADGTYTVSVSAKANGTAVTANALQLGTVNSISKASDGSVEANVSGIGTVPVSDIKLIL
jgi:flagellar basal-body rod modification protein FlgD